MIKSEGRAPGFPKQQSVRNNPVAGARRKCASQRQAAAGPPASLQAPFVSQHLLIA